MQKLIKTIATVFGIGYLPYAGGTFASLIGLTIAILLNNINLTIILIIIGFLVSGRAEEIFGAKDSKKIVIDDLCGMLVVFLMIPMTPLLIIIGFTLYRVFDIIKIYPINRLERLPAGWGIMLDDIAAGIYANIILQICRSIIC